MMCRVTAPHPHAHVAYFLHQLWMQPTTDAEATGRRREERQYWLCHLCTDSRLWGPFVVRSGTQALPHEKSPCIKQLWLKGKLYTGIQTLLYVLWSQLFLLLLHTFFPSELIMHPLFHSLKFVILPWKKLKQSFLPFLWWSSALPSCLFCSATITSHMHQ